MTLVSAPSTPPPSHVRVMELRRLRAGELAAGERARLEEHVAGCAACRAKLTSLDEEQRVFDAEISFERFAGGVERAARQPPRTHARPRTVAFASLGAAALGLALAAGIALFVRPARDGGNQIKGAAVTASLRIGGDDGRAQRTLAAGQGARLVAGDRLRLGYRTDKARHLVALAIDDAGVVTPLYPERGASLAVGATAGEVYLPEAIELTGAGKERIVLVLGEAAFTVEAAAAAARAGAPPLGMATFSWVLEKP